MKLNINQSRDYTKKDIKSEKNENTFTLIEPREYIGIAIWYKKSVRKVQL